MFLLLLACTPPGTGAPTPTAPPEAAATPASVPASAAAPQASPSAPLVPTALAAPSKATMLTVTLVTHNDERPNKHCTPLYESESAWRDNRRATVELAEMVVAHKAAWNMQSEWEYLSKIETWESAQERSTTGGKNLVGWLATRAPTQIHVDAHTHAKSYSYADVSHLLKNLGAPQTPVIGGFIYAPPESADWEQYAQPQRGRRLADADWTPGILWGAATQGHMGGDLRASGVWRPKDAYHFTEHDPQGKLVYVGGYQWGPDGNFDGLTELLGRLRAGELKPGLYPVTISVHQCTLSTAKIQELATKIDGFASAVAAGEMVWEPISAMATRWAKDYGSNPSMAMPVGTPPGAAGKGGPGGSRPPGGRIGDGQGGGRPPGGGMNGGPKGSGMARPPKAN